MRYVTKHPEPLEKLTLTEEQLTTLAEDICLELDEGLKARYAQEQNWAECLRQYEGVPRVGIRNIPIENAPNYEVTLGAIACDAIYAQAIDLIFNQSNPLVVARATRDDKALADAVKRLQVWINHLSTHELKVRAGGEHTALDWAQLGTGVLYIPWVESVRKTKFFKVEEVGAKVLPHPIEDLLLPAGSFDDLDQMPWVGLRFWLTEPELQQRATRYGWNIDGCQPAGVVGWMRSKREKLGRTTRQNAMAFNALYEIIDVYAYRDVNDDGEDEDVLLTVDRTSRKIVDYRYMPYDRRPIRYARYQKRAHLALGMGVLEMLKQYQDELTDVHNDTGLNSRLANMRMFKGKPNAVPGGVVRAFPNKVIETPEPGEFGEVKLSDVYPSAYRNEANIIAYAERRVGVRELSGPRPSQILGGRTPGITALTMVQQTNQRFSPAFDDLRFCFAEAIMQACWRYREQLQGSQKQHEAAARNIIAVMGEEDGKTVVELLMSPRFEDGVSVELSASSASVNKAQDRQDALLLINVLVQYYEKAIQLMTIASNPQTPPPVVETAKQIAEKVGEIVDRTIRTFDATRDPSTFILDLHDAVDQLDTPQGGLEGLFQMLQQAAAGQQQPTPDMPGAVALPAPTAQTPEIVQ